MKPVFIARILFILSFSILSGIAAAQCSYRLDLGDDDGDTWFGSGVLVTIGTDVYNFTLDGINDDGKDTTIYLAVNTGDNITALWLPFFDIDVSIKLTNADGDILYESGDPGFNSLTIYQGEADCPACPKPLNAIVENVWDNRAKLRWGVSSLASPAEWLVIYGVEGFALSSGVGDTLKVPTPKATVTGLQKKTAYDAYIVQKCADGTYSKAAGPLNFTTYFTNDVGVAGGVSPVSSCDLGDSETVSVILKNYGAAPQSLLTLRYSINGIDAGVFPPSDGFFTGVLGKDSCETFVFETLGDFSAPGEYEIAIYTQMGGDEDSSNDTFYYYINNRLNAPYFQNFEKWNGGWYVDTAISKNASWAYGQPNAVFIDQAASGKNAWVTNLTGPYNANENSYLVSPCFDFSSLQDDPAIQFSLSYDLEAFYDGAYLEMSTDGGQNWAKVGAVGEGLNWYNSTNFNLNLGDVWEGVQDWTVARHNLTGAKGKSDVKLRFVIGTDPVVHDEGLAIDDIIIYVPADKDLAGLSISTLGENSECGLPIDKVTFTVANFGTQPQSNFQIAYSINNGPAVIQTLSATLDVGASQAFSFSNNFNSVDADIQIKCWTLLSGEQAPFNDTAYYTISHKPRDLPLSEDFEAGILPQGWTSTTGFVTNGHNNVSFVFGANLYESNTTFDLVTPRYGVISSKDSLRFSYRISNYFDGTTPTTLSTGTNFRIQVSTNCGSSYVTIYTINSANHITQVGMRDISLSLAQFAGKSIKVRVRGQWSNGDFWFDIDNINITHTVDNQEIAAGVNQFDLMPNPTSGQTTLAIAMAEPSDLQVAVLNLSGQVVHQFEATNVLELNRPLDIENQPDGIYFVRVQANGRVVTRKLVKSN